MKWLTLLSSFLLFIDVCLSLAGDPYKILGIHKSALAPEIRKAYKQLAKEWHPDKNNNPGAEDKFVEITQAYELLSDPERRRQYDTFGRSDDFRQSTAFDPVDDLFAQSGFRFRYPPDRDITLFHKMSVSARAFENVLMPKSHRQPYLLLFYSDWCFACLQMEPIWRRVTDELEPIGVGVATVHTEHEPMLARRVGVHGLPCLAILIEGKTYIYKQSVFSIQKVVEFVRHRLPYRLVQPVNDETVDEFLSGWSDNLVRGLLFQKSEPIRLRYLLTVFYHRDRVAFGFVQTTSADTVGIRTRFQTQPDKDSLLLFNENTEQPVASVSMADIPKQTIHDIINNNQYLLLPRLSSQAMLDALCPVGWWRSRRRLCVVLVSQEYAPEHQALRQTLRRIAQEYKGNAGQAQEHRVRFMYVYQERQAEFVNALTQGSPPSTAEEQEAAADQSRPGGEGGGHDQGDVGDGGEALLHNVAILWRRDQSHIKFEWLRDQRESRGNQQPINSYNETKQRIEAAIDRVLHTNQPLAHEAVVGELIDEHAQGFVMRLLQRILFSYESLRESLGKEHILPAISVFATVIAILSAGYLMAYLMRLEETRVQEEYQSTKRHSSKRQATKRRDSDSVPFAASDSNATSSTTFGCHGNNNNNNNNQQLKLHEMRAETFNGLVRLLRPGCRTILLLVDTQSRAKLLPKFHKIVWPYRKNKTLLFAHLNLDRGLAWYSQLLSLSLSEPRELTINPRNCIGTVLSLNGLRKYFCMYHAKHPECRGQRANKRMSRMTRQVESGGGASFLGFDDSQSEDSEDSDIEQGLRTDHLNGGDKYSQVIFQETLLDGLPNWLDRLFEGSTHRYYINYWPDFIGK
ncbi:dnaJ homolog subfamily C member 16 [Nilaparvata lugens]|uniref:dnaJ homolog subfamily C member 16 n=1 Tax=Nilaparvata lugens TaxID=108931 RepID=UPI00193CE065|nr:dnaJ homolog subfamily C member 16 [Nilaparvata lugens]